MNRNFTQQTPVSFTLNRRTHSVSSWKELVHELLEDLFVSLDRDGARIAEAVIPDSGRRIVHRTGCPGKYILLSNGLQLPSDYAEQEYAQACRIICIVYTVTPCEMSIMYAESSEEAVSPDESAPESEPAAEPQEKSGSVNENEQHADPKTGDSFAEFESNLRNDFQIETNHSSFDHISRSEEKWLKLMLDKEEEEKPSDRIQLTVYDDKHEIMLENPDWDNIIDNLKHDSQALAAAKLMKKAGIKPPVMNFRGIKEHNKVGGEALFVWMDEGVAYLHGRQKYSRGYFYERRFKYVILDDPRELVDCFRKIEAEHE